MKIIKQSYEILYFPKEVMQIIELAGRTCYKSEDKITDKSANKFVSIIIKNGHHSVIEHANASVRFVTDRGITHELVRHRLASFSQESTRYVNYGGDNIQFILPVWCYDVCNKNKLMFQTWESACSDSEWFYKELMQKGWKPEQARSVLNNSLKTEIVVTCNIREWRHIFSLRCSKKAHPQMRELMIPVLKEFHKIAPILFEDITKKLKWEDS